ncbi:MAG: CBS domain-containing protein, partial [Methanomassiliicoccus sp.]
MRMEDIVVGDVMTESPVTADIGDTVSDVMAVLKRYRVREVPVLKDGLTVGLI